MAINEYKTRTGVELVAEGVIRGIYFNPLKEVVNRGRDGRDWFPTHSINVLIDDDRISLGLTDAENVRCKDESGEYHDLVVGMEISVVVEEGTEYKGKMQYLGRSSTVIITKLAEKSYSGNKGNYNGEASVGVQVGHAINCAIQLLGGEAYENSDQVIELAKKFHTLTVALKKEYAEKYPDVPEKSIGYRVGQGVLSSTNIVGSFDEVEAVARNTIEVIATEIEEFVKASKEEKPAVVKKTPANKTATKKATKTTKKAQEEQVVTESLDDMDDDIPF